MKSIRTRKHEEEDKIIGLGQTLSLIDHHIENLRKLSFPQDLVQLNLHCNKIKKIENFECLANLQLLDLSSNEIEHIEGLEYLANLKVLNLSCNQIEVVSGLGVLRRLEKLDVSYNVIHDLTGFKDVKPNTHSLKFIELHGNQITSLSHAIGCLANCGKLEVLTLKKNDDGNPICDVPAYLPNVFAQLPKLKVLDGKDRHGNIVTSDQLESFHPGLDEYLQWLVESNPPTSNTEASDSSLDFTTPKIDEVLERFRIHRQDRFTRPTREEVYGSEQESETHQVTERLGLLEKQIDSLVKMQMQRQMIPEKDRTTTTSTESKGRIPEPIRQQRVKNKKVQNSKGSQSKGKGTGQEVVPLVRGKATKVMATSSSAESQPAARKVRDPKDDEAALMMIKELDEERERRWKAEQAARKLVITVKEMQEKLSEERRIAEAAITTSTRLKNSLTSEKEARINCEKALKENEVKYKEMSKQLEMLRNNEEGAKRIIESFEETSRNAERERLKVQALKDKQLQEAQFKAAASIREAELLQGNVKNFKDKVFQLQELLANREQDHKVTLAGMIKLDGREFKCEIEKEMAKQEGRYSQLIHQYNERLEARNRDYALLEDEFRAGLQMEANRFSELQEAYSQIVNENSELRKSFQLVKQKEGKATSLVTELTSMVKEQKGRLEELSKVKQEMQSDYKERLLLLQSQLESGRRQLSKMETARQEKDKLLAQVKAQESVIEGLRTERKLWGQELAQQGASLAQDRGRLEAQIESLTNQVKHLRQKEQENIDALKIKAKLIEDQTDTIKKLKKEASDGKTELKKVKEEVISERRSLEVDLEEEKNNSRHLQEEVEALSDRKMELKSQLSMSSKELEETKEELRSLKIQWKERSQMIDTLQEKVMKMKENYDNKEKKLKEERDSSLKSANSLREKLKTCDDAFRRQIEEQKRENELEIRRLMSSKNDEIEAERQKVLEVENEMRIVLEESVITKKNFEMKIKQLSKAFADVQVDLTS